MGNWELNLGPLEEQVFLTTEPFLHCCRIFDHTVSLEMGLFTGKKQVFSCGVTQPLAHTFNAPGWNKDMSSILTFNPKQ